MKKIYSKPEAELISFYSNEEITALESDDRSGVVDSYGVTGILDGWS